MATTHDGIPYGDLIGRIDELERHNKRLERLYASSQERVRLLRAKLSETSPRAGEQFSLIAERLGKIERRLLDLEKKQITEDAARERAEMERDPKLLDDTRHNELPY